MVTFGTVQQHPLTQVETPL